MPGGLPTTGTRVIKMAEGMFRGIIKPLIPFNCIFDTDFGLIQLISQEYRNRDIFNIDYIDSLKTNYDLLYVLYHRNTYNPLIPFMNNPEDIDLAEDLYIQFIEKEYENMVARSIHTGLYNLIGSMRNTEEIITTICYSNDIEKHVFANDTLLSKIRSINIDNIVEYLSYIDQYYFKATEDLYFYLSCKTLKSNSVYILDYDFNFENKEKGILKQSREIGVALANRCVINIIGAFDKRTIH